MINLMIGGVDVSKEIVEYSISRSPQSGSSSGGFKNWDGTTIYDDKTGGGTRLSISAKLEELSDSLAESLDNALRSKTVSVNYTSPAASSAVCRCTSYKCEVDDAGFDGKNPTWNASVTLEADYADTESAESGSL